MIQREKDLRTAGYHIVTGYVDTECRYSIWQKGRLIVIVDDRTDRQISVGKLDSFGDITGKHTYTVERDCCTSGQCLTCMHLPRGEMIRVVHWKGIATKNLAEEVAANWSEYHSIVRIDD